MVSSPILGILVLLTAGVVILNEVPFIHTPTVVQHVTIRSLQGIVGSVEDTSEIHWVSVYSVYRVGIWIDAVVHCSIASIKIHIDGCIFWDIDF